MYRHTFKVVGIALFLCFSFATSANSPTLKPLELWKYFELRTKVEKPQETAFVAVSDRELIVKRGSVTPLVFTNLTDQLVTVSLTKAGLNVSVVLDEHHIGPGKTITVQVNVGLFAETESKLVFEFVPYFAHGSTAKYSSEHLVIVN